MSQEKLIDIAGGQYVPTVCLVTSTGSPYTASGGGGGGSAIADMLFKDDSGTVFIYRDDGGVTPTFSSWKLDGTAYTVGANPVPHSVKNVVVTGSVTANAGTNLNTSTLALESGGNLATLVTSNAAIKTATDTINTSTAASATSDATTATNTGATKTSVDTMSAKLPAALGATTSANSMSVTPATNANLLSDGTTGGSVISGDSGQNAQVITASRKEVTFTTTTVQAVASTDVSNYSHVSVHIVTQGGSSTVTFQGSNDNTNWVSVNLSSTVATVAGAAASATAASIIYAGPIVFRYFRLNVTGIVSGTTAGVIEFSSLPKILHSGGAIVGLQNGQAAHASSITGAPIRNASRALTANYTAVTTGQTADEISTLVGAKIVRPYSIPEADWSYAAATSGIANTTTAVTIAASAGAGLRNYITSIQVMAEVLGTATELAIRDGAGGTVLWKQKITTAGLPSGMAITFPSPIKSSAATLLEVVTLTASTTGAVYFNAQGYIAP